MKKVLTALCLSWVMDWVLVIAQEEKGHADDKRHANDGRGNAGRRKDDGKDEGHAGARWKKMQ